MLLDKFDLAKYLITKHKEKFNNRKISPIKLQKGLYFLYAYWGGKIRSQTLVDDTNEGMTEMTFSYDEDLFEASFEAWAYGPVDRDVYGWFRNMSTEQYNEINYSVLEGIDSQVSGYIEDLTNKILNTNDFVLVDLSHEDQCWSSVFNPSKKAPMSSDAIKTEYAHE